MRGNRSDTLIVTYGRIYNNAFIAQKELSKKGIVCDLLKLTKIFPICNGIVEELLTYRRISFFEEACGEGSISEKIGDRLAEAGYSGEYSRVAVEGFVKQAPVSDILDSLGLAAGKMAEYITGRCGGNGKA